jgi:hypothetical protein
MSENTTALAATLIRNVNEVPLEHLLYQIKFDLLHI